MIWHRNKNINPEDFKSLSNGNYVIVRKEGVLVGGPIVYRGGLTEAVGKSTLPNDKIEIKRFKINSLNGVSFLNDVYIHPKKYFRGEESNVNFTEKEKTMLKQ